MPACVGNPLAGDPIWEASSASELRIAITTKQVSRAGHPSDLLVAKTRALVRPRHPCPDERRGLRSPALARPMRAAESRCAARLLETKSSSTTSDSAIHVKRTWRTLTFL